MKFIPRPPPEPVRKCARCKLRTPEKHSDCVHCADLSDAQLHALLDKHQMELEGNATLGKYFLLGAIAIGIFLLSSRYGAG